MIFRKKTLKNCQFLVDKDVQKSSIYIFFSSFFRIIIKSRRISKVKVSSIFKLVFHSYICSVHIIHHFLADEENQKHDLTSVWLGQSVIGVIGAVLNTICLAIFLIGRHHLLSSINATIW